MLQNTSLATNLSATVVLHHHEHLQFPKIVEERHGKVIQSVGRSQIRQETPLLKYSNHAIIEYDALYICTLS